MNQILLFKTIAVTKTLRAMSISVSVTEDNVSCISALKVRNKIRDRLQINSPKIIQMLVLENLAMHPKLEIFMFYAFIYFTTCSSILPL